MPNIINFFKSRLVTTPQKLRGLQVAGIILSILACLVSLTYTLYFGGQVQTLSKDTVPSIVAAEKLRYQLAMAHTNLLNVFINNEKNGPHWNAYRQSIENAQQSYLDAAQNITYGDTEIRPLYEVMTRLNEYERLVGAARVNGGYSPELISAHQIMEEKIIPASIALDNANYQVLDAEYTHFKHNKYFYIFSLSLFFAFILAYLIYCQNYLFKKTKRKFNIGLMAACGSYIIGIGGFLIVSLFLFSNIHKMKDDAFDSLHTLWKAKSTSSELTFMESLYLLAHDDKSEEGLFIKSFDEKKSSILQNIKNELDNITFEGEKEAATKTSNYFNDYIASNTKLRALEKTNHESALQLYFKETGMGGIFTNYLQALDKVIEINQSHFVSAAKSGFRNVLILKILSFLIPLLIGLGIFFGFKVRIDEYNY